jgi:hypothetical protein
MVRTSDYSVSDFRQAIKDAPVFSSKKPARFVFDAAKARPDVIRCSGGGDT